MKLGLEVGGLGGHKQNQKAAKPENRQCWGMISLLRYATNNMFWNSFFMASSSGGAGRTIEGITPGSISPLAQFCVSG